MGYVFKGDLFINQELVAKGYARAYELPNDWNTRYTSILDQAERDAIEKELGLWAHSEEALQQNQGYYTEDRILADGITAQIYPGIIAGGKEFLNVRDQGLEIYSSEGAYVGGVFHEEGAPYLLTSPVIENLTSLGGGAGWRSAARASPGAT